MCELFGMNSAVMRTINPYLEEFYSHSVRHPHGWGFAKMEGDSISIEKEPVTAVKSRYLKAKLKAPVRVKNAFGHIRYATIGNVQYTNCHPYEGRDDSGRQWVLIHNGTVVEYEPMDRFMQVQEGDSDSERIMLYMLSCMNEKIHETGRALTPEERFEILDEIVCDASPGNKLNLLIYDGEYMYAHTNYEDSLYYLKKDRTIFFATVPLTEEPWRPLPMTRLVSCRNGEMAACGTNHGHEYFEDKERMKYLYQIFSEL